MKGCCVAARLQTLPLCCFTLPAQLKQRHAMATAIKSIVVLNTLNVPLLRAVLQLQVPLDGHDTSSSPEKRWFGGGAKPSALPAHAIRRIGSGLQGAAAPAAPSSLEGLERCAAAALAYWLLPPISSSDGNSMSAVATCTAVCRAVNLNNVGLCFFVMAVWQWDVCCVCF